VVKNQTKLNNPNSRFPFYTKIVGNKFAEKKSVKPFDHTKIQRQAELVATVETVVTPARVQKQIFKLIDEGNLPEDWQPCDMKIIAENMGSMIYKDCLKEEPEVVEKVGKSFGAIAYKVAMEIATQILKEKNK
jgi:hypothetical protein